MNENAEEPSALFNKILLGAITDEEWENYKEENLQSGLIVESDSEEDSLFGDSRSASPLSFEENFTTTVELIPETSGNVSEVSGDDDDDASKGETEKPSLSWNSDAAFKFINGEINISDLENIMENENTKFSLEVKREDSDKAVEPGEMSEMEKAAQEYDEEKKLSRKRVRRKKSLVPKELHGVMGAANLNFAKGKFDDAIKICMEIIRLAPNAYEPFHTLGMIYEEKGEMEKALQYSLLAAYLNPSDSEEWGRLAELSVEQGHIQQAISCYSNAVKNDPTNIHHLWERCSLYMMQGDTKKALVGYEQVIKLLHQPEAGKTCVDLSIQISQIYQGNQDNESAVRILDTVFTKFPDLITSEDVNILLELQISQKLYAWALKNLVQHCGVSIHINDSEALRFEEIEKLAADQFPQVTACSVPDILPLDLHAKLIVCIIHLKSLSIIEDLLQPLWEESAEEMGDLYLDVAEAFIEIEEHKQAIPLLSSLLASEKYNLAAVWLRYAECLNALSKTEEAIEAYVTVIKMAPTHQAARLSLSEIYLKQGSEEKAISCLKQDYEGNEDSKIDLQVLLKRIKLLYDKKKWDEFIDESTLALYSHCYFAKTPEEFNVIVTNMSSKSRNEALKELPPVVTTIAPEFTNKNASCEEMWELFKKVCEKLYHFRRLEDLQNISIIALTSTMFSRNVAMKKDVEFLALLSCYYNNDEKYSYLLIRDLVTRNINCQSAWNLFCLVITTNQDIRHNKFCLRLTMKNQDHLSLGLLNGNNALISGSYKHALAEYLSIMEDHNKNWIVNFCLGITYFHMASQKFASKRFYLAIQGMRYLEQYLIIRGKCQETIYNIGRALHQLGLNTEALYYYQRALDMAPAISSEQDEGIFDLTREIAYNVSQIYENSCAHELAYMYIRKFISV